MLRRRWMAGSSPAMTSLRRRRNLRDRPLRRSMIGRRLLRRSLLAFGGGQRAAHLVGRFQRALDMFVVRFAFEEDQDVAVRALPCIAVLDAPGAIPEPGIASGATNLN